MWTSKELDVEPIPHCDINIMLGLMHKCLWVTPTYTISHGPVSHILHLHLYILIIAWNTYCSGFLTIGVQSGFTIVIVKIKKSNVLFKMTTRWMNCRLFCWMFYTRWSRSVCYTNITKTTTWYTFAIFPVSILLPKISMYWSSAFSAHKDNHKQHTRALSVGLWVIRLSLFMEQIQYSMNIHSDSVYLTSTIFGKESIYSIKIFIYRGYVYCGRVLAAKADNRGKYHKQAVWSSG